MNIPNKKKYAACSLRTGDKPVEYGLKGAKVYGASQNRSIEGEKNEKIQETEPAGHSRRSVKY